MFNLHVSDAERSLQPGMLSYGEIRNGFSCGILNRTVFIDLKIRSLPWNYLVAGSCHKKQNKTRLLFW